MTRLLHRQALRGAAPERRGAALLLSLLVLLVLVAIISQINIATSTDARVGRNDLYLTTMDLAIESALLEVSETLAADAESTGGEEGGAGGGAEDPLGGLGGAGLGGGEGGGEGGDGPVDSRQDDWATPIRTEINGIRLRVLIQDEDSKYNILTMLSEDELEAEKAFERVVRILDLCREGTEADIDGGDAREMVEQMREHLVNRQNSMSGLPKPTLLTDDEEEEPDLGLPLSLREFVCLPAFSEEHFRDFRDEDGVVVHSITSFLTCWTALTTLDEAEDEESTGAADDDDDEEEDGAEETVTAGGGQGGLGDLTGASGQGTQDVEEGAAGLSGDSSKYGIAININTAPPVVLKSLMDDRDLALRFWDAVIEYRNEEDEEAVGEDEEPPLDEFGEPILIPQIFESLSELDEFDDYENLDDLLQGELNQLLTVESQVFSVYVTARKPTGAAASMDFAGSKEEILEEEESGQALSRTVRSVLWRRQGGDGFELIPIERWEVLDYMPFEVLDFPEEDR
ncbi:MAG: hypothetical protein AAF682_26235 [Planctomycetota bacterium]